MKIRLFALAMILCSWISCYATKEKPKIADFKYNVYSQFGEDGVVSKIFEIIGTTSKVAVEFGAADGFWFSNTANLWSKDPSWFGVLIECSPAYFSTLEDNARKYSCLPIYKAVQMEGPDSLESILLQHNITETLDLLSIDIDGNDYYILQSIENIRPRVIICEYNPTIPAELDIYPYPNNGMGCSVRALERVANEKGYVLVAITDTNCFFVLQEDFPKFAEYDTSLRSMKIESYIRYIYTDYSGMYRTVGSKDFINPYGMNGHAQYPVLGDFTPL